MPYENLPRKLLEWLCEVCGNCSSLTHSKHGCIDKHSHKNIHLRFLKTKPASSPHHSTFESITARVTIPTQIDIHTPTRPGIPPLHPQPCTFSPSSLDSNVHNDQRAQDHDLPPPSDSRQHSRSPAAKEDKRNKSNEMMLIIVK